jgi:hypothetical protein
MGLDFVKLEIGNLVSMGLVWGQILRFGFCVISSSFCHEPNHVNGGNFVQYFIGICKITRA